MKKNEDIKTIYLGERKLKLIQGLKIKRYLPESIMDNVNSALKDQDMIWDDETITKCTLVISGNQYFSMMYVHAPIRFNGLYLFGYSMERDNKYIFSFPKKWLHLDYYKYGLN